MFVNHELMRSFKLRFQSWFRVSERPDGPAGEDAAVEALPRRNHLGAQGRPYRLRFLCLPPLRRTLHIRVALRARIFFRPQNDKLSTGVP